MSTAMDLSGQPVEISDHDRLMAAWRAFESKRPDRLFADPFAKDLAGPEGEELRQRSPHAKLLGVPIIVRSVLIDEMIVKLAVGNRIQTVVALGAGLDTRPYRLALPSSLRWVEMEKPEVLHYKQTVLKKHAPRCRYEVWKGDWTDGASLRQRLRDGREGWGVTLLLTEGVLHYFEPKKVQELADDIRETGRCDYWMTDVISQRVLSWLQRPWGGTMGPAPMHFATRRGQGTFLDWGYRVLEQHGLISEAQRRGRPMTALPKTLQGDLDRYANTLLLDEMVRVVLLRRLGAEELPPVES